MEYSQQLYLLCFSAIVNICSEFWSVVWKSGLHLIVNDCLETINQLEP
jgi:hypothetical protein